MNEIESFLRSW